LVFFIENNAPTFRNDNLVFNLTIGEEFVYTIIAEDEDGDALEFTSTGLPPGATVQKNPNNITFRWLVNSTQPVWKTCMSKNENSTTLPPPALSDLYT
jgi:hypothetical protein